jgi:death-on-curing protein
VKTPQWINRRALLLLHEETLAEHGGLRGLRDEGLFDAALARPQHVHTYEAKADLARLAAACGFGLVRNHPSTMATSAPGSWRLVCFLL